MTVKELCELYNRRLTAIVDCHGNWCVWIESCEISEPGVLVGVSGRGPTIGDALANYAQQIGGKRAVFDAGRERRLEMKLPKTLEGR